MCASSGWGLFSDDGDSPLYSLKVSFFRSLRFGINLSVFSSWVLPKLMSDLCDPPFTCPKWSMLSLNYLGRCGGSASRADWLSKGGPVASQVGLTLSYISPGMVLCDGPSCYDNKIKSTSTQNLHPPLAPPNSKSNQQFYTPTSTISSINHLSLCLHSKHFFSNLDFFTDQDHRELVI